MLLHRTMLGRHPLAAGGNEEAARLSGVPVRRVKTAAHALRGGRGAMLATVIGVLTPAWIDEIPSLDDADDHWQ